MDKNMTVSCGNIFEDVGFPPDVAAAMFARATLIVELEKALKERGLKQEELAKELDVPRTRISEIMNHKTEKFSLDKLVGLLYRAGKQVELRVV